MKKNITIKDIAKYCDVSAMTVSRAFRKDSKINPATRKLIIQCAADHGYLKGAKQGRPKNKSLDKKLKRIQLIFGSQGKNPALFHTRLLTSLEQQLAKLGCECIIRSSTGDYECFVSLLEAAQKSDTYATIILGNFPDAHLQALLSAFPGAFLLDNSGVGIHGNTYSSFSFDNSQAAFMGVDYLISMGRKKILLVNGNKQHAFANEIFAGYQRALEKNHLAFLENRVLTTDFSADDAAHQFRKYLNHYGKDSIDAIFTNDEMAVGIYKVMHENKLKIPEEIAICGCDNLPIGEQLYPELTTVMLDYDKLVQMAVEQFKKESFDIVTTKIMPTLLVKKST